MGKVRRCFLEHLLRGGLVLNAFATAHTVSLDPLSSAPVNRNGVLTSHDGPWGLM